MAGVGGREGGWGVGGREASAPETMGSQRTMVTDKVLVYLYLPLRVPDRRNWKSALYA